MALRYFQRLVLELQALVDQSEPGAVLSPPSLLCQTEVFGSRLAYMKMGFRNGGPPVILLHGFGGFFMDWPRIMVPASSRVGLYALDLNGWGFSEPLPDASSVSQHVSVIGEFVRQKGFDSVTLVGASYGAAVAWAAAAEGHPWVNSIMLLNPMPPHPLKWMHSPLYQSIFWVNRNAYVSKLSHRFLTRTQYRWVVKENLYNQRLIDTFYLKLGYLVLKQPQVGESIHQFARLAGAIDWDLWAEKLKSIRVPTYILQGENDRLFSTESAAYLAGLIPQSRLELIPKCAHAMIFDQHRLVTVRLLEWLADGRRRQSPVKATGTST